MQLYLGKGGSAPRCIPPARFAAKNIAQETEMARPAKSSSIKRGAFVRARLTPSELDVFDSRAKAAGLNRSDFLRQAALRGRVVIRRTNAPDPLLIAELNRIGVNLNQLAKTANITGKAPPELDRLCQRIEEAVMRAIEREVA